VVPQYLAMLTRAPHVVVGGVKQAQRFIGMYSRVIRSGELLKPAGVKNPRKTASTFDNFLSTARARAMAGIEWTNAGTARHWATCACKNGSKPNGNTS